MSLISRVLLKPEITVFNNLSTGEGRSYFAGKGRVPKQTSAVVKVPYSNPTVPLAVIQSRELGSRKS